jgi:hypothetical protein
MRQITKELAISGFILCLAWFCTPFVPTLWWHGRVEDDEPETKTRLKLRKNATLSRVKNKFKTAGKKRISRQINIHY